MPNLTNKHLNQLVADLGFQPGEICDRNRAWRHPASGCVVLLPANKATEAPRPALLVTLKAHLSQQGHFDETTFDDFVGSGQLPAPRA